MMQPVRVTFLTFYFEAWDALAEVYEQMLADPRFEVSVVVVPRRLTGDLHWDNASAASNYFDSIGVAHKVFDYEDSWVGNERMRALAPDYVFINYPWQRNYQPGYRADALAAFTRLAYVPYYSVPLVNEPADGAGVASHLYTQRPHQLASLVFTQDAFVRDAYAATSRGNAHVHFTGSPKVDSLIRAGVSAEANSAARAATGVRGRDRYRVVWAPHHSYSPHWLNFGVFVHMHIQMLAWARDHSDIDVVLRPHPFMFGTLVDREVMNASEVAEWRTAWDELPNTSVDETSAPADLFANCDLLLTDGISFLVEYPLVTGKPCVFIEHSGHWPFSPIGEVAAAANVRLNSFEDFVAGYEFLREAGLPAREVEVAALRAAAMPFAGEAASRIVEIVAADYASGSALVDPTTITEVAWERQPGREPLID